MVTYKNIRIKMKSGKTRLQRVKVLASGKYKFVKNLTKKGSNPKKGGKKIPKKKGGGGGKKLIGNLGATGALEDLAIGYIGTSFFAARGYPLESALPMTRVAQGAIGLALNRRGKGRLAYGLIDLIDIYLIKNTPALTNGISLKAWM